jgi:hypothetical protein
LFLYIKTSRDQQSRKRNRLANSNGYMVMLASSTAESSTLCADYEIGLRLRPQDAHPSAGYEARHTRHPGHTGFGQTWSATKGAIDNIVCSTVQITPAVAVRRRKEAWHGMSVESIEARGHSKIEYRFHASTNMLAMYDQGMRRGGETTIEHAAIDNPEL